jgi:hypothetical protein
MNIVHIIDLLKIGQLSLDLRAAELVADDAKHAYHTAWRQFEIGGVVSESEPEVNYVAPDERVRTGHPLFHEAQKATAQQFAAHKDAKRAAYNVKRRWMSACRSVK